MQSLKQASTTTELLQKLKRFSLFKKTYSQTNPCQSPKGYTIFAIKHSHITNYINKNLYVCMIFP
jgi:hypothetical protein